ncbi:MAG: sigma-54 dependent transcriptional regulator [Proteobacteria bacterium]|nr:sigma-54 dependent transcriptional regulator [Pseudomonadota bacterium]
MQKPGKLLIVDDEAVALRNLERVMSKAGYSVTAVQSGDEAQALLEAQEFDLLLTDLRMEKVDGMRLLNICRSLYPDSEVIMITGNASTQSAVEAMRQGAFYYITKPFRLDEVRKVVAEAMEKIRLRNENRSLKQQIEAFEGKVRIVTQDAGMLRLLELARQVAPTDCNVMIVGESGTGKELFARYLHQQSARHAGPYVAVNCGAFSRDLLANELFGHERDAFTGAHTQKKGLVESASGGTLFLDEVTEMSPEMQVKLLRVIQEKEVLRLGATQPVKVDIRVIAATNRDLAEAVAVGILRQDLYFRLNVVTLAIPPLSQRRGDIPLLAQYFLQKHAVQMKKTLNSIAPAVLEVLQCYDYPGNVRELENIIARGCAVSAGDRIELAHLSENLRQQNGIALPGRGEKFPTLEQQEKTYIRWVLKEFEGNQTTAAAVLGINRSSLWRKIKTFNERE